MVQSQEKSPLVAIVTPVYNGAEFLAETLACVQAQTYSNLIHIVLDNASTDATPEIISRYSGGRVPILNSRNRETIPQRDNWEAAVRMTPKEADYFLLLCADDLLTADAIEKLVGVAESDSAIGVVGCLWTMGSDPHGATSLCGTGLPKDRSVFDGRWFVKAYLVKLHFATSPQCQLFRRHLLDESVPFYANDEMLMDIDVSLRALLRWRYGFVHSALGFTRAHDQRITVNLNAATQAFVANWLAFIDRYGPQVMSPIDLATCRRAYLRHYLRRLLLWRFRDRNKGLFDTHIALLKAQGVRPTLLDYIEAVIEWMWLVLNNRRNEVGAARSLWPRTQSELMGI
ncbi:MAG TPA: glycosyltransferase [Methylocella sp.]|nr:glycosyltransferase [Methylocella sp.]